MYTNSTLQKIAPIILRVGLGIVMVWFGWQQLGNAAQWTSFLPTWAGALPISSIALVHLNGWFEVTFGLMLIVGFYTQFVALLLGLHLFGITFTVGLDAIGMRDFGLSMATISLACLGGGAWSLDQYFS